MRPASGIEKKFSFRKDTRNQRQIRKVCPAFIWIVQDHHVAWSHLAVFDRRFDRQRHRTQMYRHVISLRDHVAAVVEDRARVVTAFLDVRRKSCTLQRRTHFFCNRVKQAFEDFQLHRVNLRYPPPRRGGVARSAGVVSPTETFSPVFYWGFALSGSRFAPPRLRLRLSWRSFS